jgi:hypothetical protein
MPSAQLSASSILPASMWSRQSWLMGFMRRYDRWVWKAGSYAVVPTKALADCGAASLLSAGPAGGWREEIGNAVATNESALMA